MQPILVLALTIAGYLKWILVGYWPAFSPFQAGAATPTQPWIRNLYFDGGVVTVILVGYAIRKWRRGTKAQDLPPD
jgi:hypothetical protein